MSSHSNSTMAHDFYYFGVDLGRRASYSSCTLSYDGNTGISYSTAVAKVIPRKGVAQKKVTTRRPSTGITLVSYYRMSSTTGRHISDLSHASPFTVVRVPLTRGWRDFTPNDVRDSLLDCLGEYASEFNLAGNRRAFVQLMNAREFLLKEACEEWAKPLRDRRFRKFEKIDVEKAAAELKERNRKAAAKRAKETKALFARYLKNKRDNYCEFMRVLFDPLYESLKFPFDKERRALLRSRLDKDAAYVWVDGDRIRTSRCVSVPVDEARVLLKAWAAGKDMRMMRIASYTIVAYEGDVIKIGCHAIPRENMLALYEEIVGEPFPDRQKAVD